MLNTLSLSSFALIDQAVIHFNQGFHVLTGETGAGKTLLIQAIHLLTGHKVSTDIIRLGAETAIIEATFDIENLPAVQNLLLKGGIDVDPQELLIIKREVSRSSKNRIFINAQPSPLSLLAAIGPHLLELVSQNSSQSIRQEEAQRELLDLYGEIDKAPYELSYQSIKDLEKSLLNLKAYGNKDKLERLQWELQEWDAFTYQEGEEEALFNEYKTLAGSQEITDKLTAIQGGLGHPQLIPALSQLQKLTDNPTLQEHLKSAIVHLQEASFAAAKQLESLEHSPGRLQELEERLSMLNQLKRKYHVDDIPSHVEKLREEVDTLEHLDEKLATMEKELEENRKQLKFLAEELSKKRTDAAKTLSKALTGQLHSLNLPHAKALIAISPKDLSQSGQDRVVFSLAANPGEAPASLASRSSGGEVARFLFALKLLLAEKGALPTLVFDEIDANVGGETAALLGQKLHELGKHSQVLAITHFPQVARQANYHLQITKKEKEGRTLTEISPLQAHAKEKELLRMLGGSLNLFPESRK